MLATVQRTLDTWSTVLDFGALTAQAHSVVTYRTLGATGNWSLEQDENHRMVTEKPVAFLTANIAASLALLEGRQPDQIARAWIAPLSDAVESNRDRLQRRGPAGVAAYFNKSGVQEDSP